MRDRYPGAAAALDAMSEDPATADVDAARIANAVRRAAADPDYAEVLAGQVASQGSSAALPASGVRALPGGRHAVHNLAAGQVRLGRPAPDSRGQILSSDHFGVDLDVLRTSLLAVGPPGSGKTRGIAVPVVEHLCLGALAGQSSVVVVDPKGTDFGFDGWFDVTIDPLAPTCGFSLFGGARSADAAADRLASTLLPPDVSDDKAYFVDASRNALYSCLAPFHAAFGRWPAVPELLALLRAEQSALDRVKSALKGPGAKEHKTLLDTRVQQGRARVDAAASLVERFALLDRPAMRGLFDHPGPVFRMEEVNRPVRVRVVLPESELPDASRILARIVVSQFVQTVSAPDADRGVFKGLVIDEAGRFVDDYVARGVQRLRSGNAGLVLLSQSLSDFPAELRHTVFGSTGCKVVFGGVDPNDADVFSAWFGEHYETETVRSVGSSTDRRYDRYGRPAGGAESESRGLAFRRVERPRWSASDIITGVPRGHALVCLARSSGERVGPVLVDLRS
ncbi:type IV secretory system conjugative DNA transfer family protein [Streptomonospora wellingtoniae]|uniref:TraM recognition domain-containing protein n=1 Tax=Streptomonospora wellingtoniae TaxID=3075544 RepID=A0ABU2KNW5_9ACTN|nr:TraM recognition domain-containing protein [Streptomonospora sp. DSM 45055]MDT0300960.1 TraM recognition domain-containing protein [Streptomonospora sp. DSM 45055]